MSGDEIAVALAAILLGSAIKSISGMGLPLVSIPIISFVTDLETAVAAVAIPNLLINVAMAWRSRESRAEARDLPVLGATGIVGGIVGTYALMSFSEAPLVVALIAVVAIYVITFVRMPDFRISPAASRRAAPGVGLATGLLQGAIGISGPLIGSWIHCCRLERRAHIFSITTLFALAGARSAGGAAHRRRVVRSLDGRRARLSPGTCHRPVRRAPSQPVQLGRVRPFCRRNDRGDRDRFGNSDVHLIRRTVA